MMIRTVHVGTPPSVIPVKKAGIHRRSPLAHGVAPDTPIAGAPSVIPAKAGIHGRRRHPDSALGTNPSMADSRMHPRMACGSILRST